MKNGDPKIFEVRLNNNDEMKDFMKENGGGMLSNDNNTVAGVIKGARTYDDIVDGSTYFMVNRYYDAVLNSRTRAQVEDRVLEEQVSSAMVNYIGKGAHVHVYRNVKFTDEKGRDIAELDRVVVHERGEGVPDLAFVVECALSPQVKDVKLLLNKVEVFQSRAPSSSDFRSVGPVVAVLGGRMWSEEVIQECKTKSGALGGMGTILRVQPSGKDFEVIN
jgi:hypothetical protein